MRLALAIVMVLVPVCLSAQGSSAGISHLNIPALPRPAAMGQALVADPGSLTSSVTNPANLLNPGSTEIVLSHSSWIQDVRSEFLSARIPVSGFSAGLSVRSTNIEGIEIRERPGPPIGTVTARSLSIGATGAVEVFDKTTVGLSLRYLYEKMYVDEANGYSADLGVLYQTPVEGLSGGFSVTNLGKLGAFRERTTELPTMLNLGARYCLPLDQFTIVVAPAFLMRMNPSTPMAAFGAEVEYLDMFSLRAGYQTGYDARGFSAGLGVRYDIFGVDYAYLPFSQDLGASHIIAVAVNF
jgi:hypothetical protein